MYRISLILLLVAVSSSLQAGVHGEFIRGEAVDSKYPQSIIIPRFSSATVDEMTCKTDAKSKVEIKTDRGNFSVGRSWLIGNNAVKIKCEGKAAFYVLDIPSKYHSDKVLKGDVVVWFGDYKDRYGCEGYTGCDKVHVLHTYHSNENIEAIKEVPTDTW